MQAVETTVWIKNVERREDALCSAEHVAEREAFLVPVPGADWGRREPVGVRVLGEPSNQEGVGEADEGGDSLDSVPLARRRVGESEQLLHVLETVSMDQRPA
jgi:hypothetical protein